MPFFPRILEHLVGLDRGVGQRRPVEIREAKLLEPMAELEQLRAAAPQFAGELGGGDALGDAAEDQDQLDRPPLGPLEDRLGEGGGDPAAGRAAKGEDRGTIAAMDLEVVAVGAMGTGQAIGMKQPHEEFVASRLVHQVADREVHDRLIRGAERLISPHFNRSDWSWKEASHPFPDMSHKVLSRHPAFIF
jgi:hypothetical protein